MAKDMLMAEPMTMYDTNIMIDYLRGKDEAAEIIRNSTDEKGISISSISCYELLAGAKGNEEEALESLFGRITVHPLDLKAARKASSLHKRLRKTGNELSAADMFIVAIAEANDEILVTQDSDFKDSYGKVIVIEK